MKLKLKKIGIVSLMIILGLIWIIGGWFGITRPDPSGHLETALTQAMKQGGTIQFYKPFLTEVVIPNKAVFAGLVAWGEFLVGISLLSGTLVKISTLVAVFLLLNYGLMNGAILQHFVLASLQLLIFFVKPSLIYGFDKTLKLKWPDSKLF